MVFCCFPPSTKCEWSHLRDFVAQYNTTNDKTYTRTACLDVGERRTKQPELLLGSEGETPIVIEHKSIVWPPDYFSDHSNEHLLGERVAGKLGSLIKDSVYGLEVHETSLKSKKKKQIEEIAEQIARLIKSNWSLAKTHIGMSGTKPIPWGFHALSPMERDDAGSKVGIVATVSSPGSGVFSDADLSSGDEEGATTGYRRQFEIAAANASEKFDQYAHCLRFLLVQFHGVASFAVDDEHMVEVIRSAKLPETIDQVWLAHPDWISEDDFEIAWRNVR